MGNNAMIRFVMTPDDLNKILAACAPVPYIVVGGMEPQSQQARANAAWCELGRRMGFDGMTVVPTTEGDRVFMASPTDTVPPPSPTPDAREGAVAKLVEAGEAMYDTLCGLEARGNDRDCMEKWNAAVAAYEKTLNP